MTQQEPVSSARPLFSIVIAVYNDWALLDECLRSLSRQTDGPVFEVILVDDGSSETVPELILSWIERFPLAVVRQSHAGISDARNRGVRDSSGAVLVFIDADCRCRPNCLAALASTIAEFSSQNCFQLHLTGDCVGLVGKAEELRLAMLQDQLLQPDGRIRYLNTSGFAIRRTAVDIETGVFNPVALRAEDTLLLATLIQRGELPRFVPNAVVQHSIPLSLMECLRKDLQSVEPVEKTYGQIAAMGVKFRLRHRERLSMLWSMWKISGRDSIGRSACFAVLGRRALGMIASFAYRRLGVRPKSAIV
jgi:cellulose synthase/poly-beta-1,6-N-acetylglucosamine synthase-like glycosyltransferase